MPTQRGRRAPVLSFLLLVAACGANPAPKQPAPEASEAKPSEESVRASYIPGTPIPSTWHPEPVPPRDDRCARDADCAISYFPDHACCTMDEAHAVRADFEAARVKRCNEERCIDFDHIERALSSRGTLVARCIENVCKGVVPEKKKRR